MATGEITYSEDIQFKIHTTFDIFQQPFENSNGGLGLLAPASAVGLLFAGNPNAPELKVFSTKQLIDTKTSGEKLLVRTVVLPGTPINIAASCDGAMIVVNYIINGSGFLNVYDVRSFLTPQIKSLYNIRLSSEENVYAHQLLWCPVFANNICVILSNGGVCMYTLKEGGQFDVTTLDKSHGVFCGCWSPKGKQIVFGFANGKLQQYKPNLALAKTIECPAGTFPGPFKTIALHWLSTYQFAVIFLQIAMCDVNPSLFIMNAPKAGTPSYVNFSDVCYSSSGPRSHQFRFTHLQTWNLLLVVSANGIEVGVLRTTEAGDTPKWCCLSLIGEGRIEMPLVNNVDETYPIGFAFDSSSTHQVTFGEQLLPVMPTIHVLSTYGRLISYNFLNLTNGAADLCSPPPPIDKAPFDFKPLSEGETNKAKPKENEVEESFNFPQNVLTSTPAVQKDKVQGLFGSNSSSQAPFGSAAVPTNSGGQMPTFGQPSSGGFGSTTESNSTMGFTSNFAPLSPQVAPKPTQFVSKPAASTFGLLATPNATSFSSSSFGEQQKTAVPTQQVETQPQQQQQQQQPKPQQSTLSQANSQSKQQLNAQSLPIQLEPNLSAKVDSEVKQPLYSVSNDYQPPAVEDTANNKDLYESYGISKDEMEDMTRDIILLTIAEFSEELMKSKHDIAEALKKTVQPTGMRDCLQRLHALQNLIDQAKERELQKDVQKLLQGLGECFEMLSECRCKLDAYNNVDTPIASVLPHKDLTAERQLAKLDNSILRNQSQLLYVQQHVDSLWEDYQDTLRRQSKLEMHIPCLEGVYQRLAQLKKETAQSRIQLDTIKNTLKEKGLRIRPTTPNQNRTTLDSSERNFDSLANSVKNISLKEKTKPSHSNTLTKEKREYLRSVAHQCKEIQVLKPKRPARVDLKSEVILECKQRLQRRAAEVEKIKKQKEKNIQTEKTKQLEKQQQSQQQIVQQNQQTLQQSKSTSAFGFNNKTAAGAGVAEIKPPTTPSSGNLSNVFSFGSGSSFVKPAFVPKDAAPTTPTSVPSSFSFAQTTNTGSPFAFGHNKGENKPPQQVPISFSAKVITSDAENSNAANATISTQPPQKSGEQGFVPFSPPQFDKTSASKANTKPIVAHSVTTSAPSSFGSLATTFGVTNFGSSLNQPSKSEAKPVSNAAATIITTTVTPSLTVTSKPAPTGNIFSSSAPPNASSAATTIVGNSSNTFGAVGFPVKTSSTSSSSTSVSSDSTESLFGSVNICKPTTITPDPAKPANMFSSLYTGSPKPPSSEAPISGSGLFSSANLPGITSSQSLTSPTKSEAEPSESLSTTFSSPIKSTAATVTTTTGAGNTTFSFGGNIFSKSDSEPLNFGTNTSTNKTPTTSSVFSIQSNFANIFTSSSSFSAPAITTAAKTTTVTVIAATSSAATPSVSQPVVTSTSAAGPNETTATAAPTTITATSVATVVTPKPAFGQTAFGTPSTTSTSSFAPSSVTSSPFVSSTTTTSTANTTNLFAALSTSTKAPVPNVNLFAASTAAPVSTAAAASTAVSSPFAATVATSSATAATQAATTTSIFATSTAQSSTTTPPATNIFGAAIKSATTSAPPSTNIFGAAVATNAPTSNIFGAAVPTSTPASPSGGSLFANAASPAPPAGGNMFGGAAASPTSPTPGLFAAAAAGATSPTAAPSPFGAQSPAAATSGGNIFANAAATPSTNIFGGGTTAAATPSSPFAQQSGTSIFGGSAAASTGFASPSTNVFGSPTSNQTVSGGSIFAQSAFGQPNANAAASGGNVFGGGSQQPSGGSIFGGGSSAQPTSGGSIFGGGATSGTATAFGSPSTGTSGFGSFSQPSAGSPFSSATGAGSFAQGGASVAQSGFGSPQQSAFSKPVFGGTPTFGSGTPAFGAAPTFGGAPTFGSPKGFGSFSTQTAATSPNANTGFGAQKNNLFETLGSSESGLSFGNLAQSNANTQQQKPVFGGSNFMNYRA